MKMTEMMKQTLRASNVFTKNRAVMHSVTEVRGPWKLVVFRHVWLSCFAMHLPSLKNLEFNRSFLLGNVFKNVVEVFKNVDVPKGTKKRTKPNSFLFFQKRGHSQGDQKKEWDPNRSRRFCDFENVSSFTNRVGFPSTDAFSTKRNFQNRGHSQWNQNCGPRCGFSHLSFLSRAWLPWKPWNRTSPGTVTKSKFTSHKLILVSRQNLFSSSQTIWPAPPCQSHSRLTS